jgi:hypothetical protein
VSPVFAAPPVKTESVARLPDALRGRTNPRTQSESRAKAAGEFAG